MEGNFSIREKIIALVKEEYPNTDEKKLREKLGNASNDDAERVFDAFCRFGVKEIFEAIM